MYEPPPGCEIVLTTQQRDQCMESRLVLESVGISCEVGYRDGSWLLVVERDDLATSTAELDAYRRENPVTPIRRGRQIPVYDGAASAVAVYAALISLIFVLNAPWGLGMELLPIGKMQAGNVMAGEWWRTVTALTLHLDTGHIIANLVFGAVFGILAGHALGGGVAWLTVVIGGALGNFINALVQAPTHTSIGASTAVFAALGVIVSHSLRHWRDDQEKRMKRWSPLIGGIVLLAFTGVGGERTDVVAHVTGFLSGLLIGWAGCRLPHRWLDSRQVQTWAGLAAIAIVASAWSIAIIVATS